MSADFSVYKLRVVFCLKCDCDDKSSAGLSAMKTVSGIVGDEKQAGSTVLEDALNTIVDHFNNQGASMSGKTPAS